MLPTRLFRGLRARVVVTLAGLVALFAALAGLLVAVGVVPMPEADDAASTVIAIGLGVAFFVVLGLVLTLLVNRAILQPLNWLASTAQALRQGYLDARVEIATGSEEMDVVARAFAEMSDELKGAVGNVAGLGERVGEATTTIAAMGDAVTTINVRQAAETRSTAGALEQVTACAQDVGSGVENVVELSSRIDTSVGEMSLSSEQIAESTHRLSDYLDHTHDSVMEITMSVDQLAGSASELQTLSTDTAAAVIAMHASIENVRDRAEKSRSLSQASHRQAASLATASAEQALAGMTRLRDVIQRSVGIIESLSGRVGEVGRITTLIDEVTEQTRLLGLNASIMAAQAGDAGRGFAVVADEIRSLSVQIAGSTRDINRLLDSMKDEARQAVEVIREGSSGAEEGVRLTEGVRGALGDIVKQAAATGDMLGEIAAATEDQSAGTHRMKELAKRVVSMAEHTAREVRGQKAFSTRIVDATQGARTLSEQVSRSTQEHAEHTRRVRAAMEELGQGLEEIASRARQQLEQAAPVQDSLRSIRDDADTNREQADRMMVVIRDLGEHAGELRQRLDRFRFRNRAGTVS